MDIAKEALPVLITDFWYLGEVHLTLFTCKKRKSVNLTQGMKKPNPASSDLTSFRPDMADYSEILI